MHQLRVASSFLLLVSVCHGAPLLAFPEGVQPAKSLLDVPAWLKGRTPIAIDAETNWAGPTKVTPDGKGATRGRDIHIKRDGDGKDIDGTEWAKTGGNSHT